MGSIESLNGTNDLEEAHSHWNRDQKFGARPQKAPHNPTDEMRPIGQSLEARGALEYHFERPGFDPGSFNFFVN